MLWKCISRSLFVVEKIQFLWCLTLLRTLLTWDYTGIKLQKTIFLKLHRVFTPKIHIHMYIPSAKVCTKVLERNVSFHIWDFAIFSPAWLCQQSSLNQNFVRLSAVRVAIISEPVLRISFKFRLWVALDHRSGPVFEFWKRKLKCIYVNLPNYKLDFDKLLFFIKVASIYNIYKCSISCWLGHLLMPTNVV